MVETNSFQWKYSSLRIVLEWHVRKRSTSQVIFNHFTYFEFLFKSIIQTFLIVFCRRRIANTETYKLNDLYPDTLYYIWLAARSQRGEGATTPPIPVRTKQYGKIQILEYKFFSIYFSLSSRESFVLSLTSEVFYCSIWIICWSDSRRQFTLMKYSQDSGRKEDCKIAGESGCRNHLSNLHVITSLTYSWDERFFEW